ncbi:MAG: 4-(cytidine 5'-diphospho)-2-C-methyl-D-erythritol kinase [Alistipes sp.]|nr:4-(cytidine 5'-diphospho)-2-C-methyl-D-erythritol kinase [Alistipes sp.]
MILEANCKINIGLDVLRRREDGFHDLETVMFPVRGLYDTVEVVANGLPCSRISIAGLGIDCPDDDNICLKAARIMTERFGTGGVDIKLCKRIPFGAGLGGGSSDGVAVIKAVNAIFNLGLSDDTLTETAAAFGSDTAFFVRNTPQLCTGRGEKVEPITLDLHGLTLVVAKPDEGVSTKEAYAGINPHVPQHSVAELVARPVAQWQGALKNDFEPSVFASHPRIHRLKQAMLEQGAVYASMSGSGSAVFGLFDKDSAFNPPFDGVFVHTEKL